MKTHRKRPACSTYALSIAFGVVVGILGLWLLLTVSGWRLVRTSTMPFGLQPRAALATSPTDMPAVIVDPGARPKNIILFVADGMGQSHLAAARLATKGIEGAATWDRFEVEGLHSAHATSGLLTDSAASATALATGWPGRNGAIGTDVSGSPAQTIFEQASALGFSTAFVTDSYIWDATPAAFFAHTGSRHNARTILEQLATSSVDLAVGELEDVGESGVPEWAETEDILSQRFFVSGPETSATVALAAQDRDLPVAILLQEDQVTDLASQPNLPTLVRAALERLNVIGAPFVLLVESEELDSASHRNDIDRVLAGVAAIEATLELLLNTTDSRGDTLLVFTSDHETGGLTLGSDDTNTRLQVSWATTGHTAVPVPVFATGPGSIAFAGYQTNWQMGQKLAAFLSPLRTPAEEPGT